MWGTLDEIVAHLVSRDEANTWESHDADFKEFRSKVLKYNPSHDQEVNRKDED
jgi:hypothetical protein